MHYDYTKVRMWSDYLCDHLHVVRPIFSYEGAHGVDSVVGPCGKG